MRNHAALLYHFCPQHAIDGIRRKGIVKGALPWNRDASGAPQMIRHMRETTWSAAEIARHRRLEATGRILRTPGFQWLTTNPTWEQPWCFLGALEFPKNAYRITVLIPPERAVKPYLLDWPELCDRCRPQSAEELNTKAVDWQNWRLFYGPIRPGWFLEIARNSGQQIIATEHGAG